MTVLSTERPGRGALAHIGREQMEWLLESHSTQRELAEMIGVGKSTVGRRMKQLGFSGRKLGEVTRETCLEWMEHYGSISAAARALGVAANAIHRHMRKHGVKSLAGAGRPRKIELNRS